VSRILPEAAEVRVRDLLLYALTVSSGAVDAISFLALGKVFSAFMTGNIAFLGLRAAGAAAPGAVAILASMAGFAAGVTLSTHIVKASQGRGVWPHPVTVALGSSLVAHAIFLVVWFASRGEPSIDAGHVLLGVWGLAMGMQSAAVRTLRVEGVFTTAATATVIFLAGDITKWSGTAVERRRLVGVLLSLFLGATAGGVLLVHAHIYAPVLPFVITAASVATAATTFRDRVWHGRPERRPSIHTKSAPGGFESAPSLPSNEPGAGGNGDDKHAEHDEREHATGRWASRRP
jgi:uncharacterized membrane protein YoaK (UPF0700 family)